MKTVYVLDGYLPEKIVYFNERNNKKDRLSNCILMDNHGDVNNKDNFYKLYEDKALDDKDTYILFGSEYQIEFIKSDDTLYKWYKDHKDQFILNTYKGKEFNYYCDKINVMNEFKDGLQKDVTVMTGDEWNNQSEEFKDSHVLKCLVGTGGKSVFFNKKFNEYSPKKPDANKTYTCEPIYDGQKFESIIVVKDSKIVFNAIFTYHKNSGQVPKFIKFEYDEEINKAVELLVNRMGVINGYLEPEFIKLDNGEVRMIDLNPRWSMDHSIIGDLKSVPEAYDMIDAWFTDFDKPVEIDYNLDIIYGVGIKYVETDQKLLFR